MDATQEKALLQQAAAAIKQGDKANAYEFIKQVLENNPKNPAAWYGMSVCADSTSDKIDCMEKVLRLSPGFPGAQQRLANLKQAANSRAMVARMNSSGISFSNDNFLPDLVIGRFNHVAGRSTHQMAEGRRSNILRYGIIGIVLIIIIFIVIQSNPDFGPYTGVIILGLFVLTGFIDNVTRSKINHEYKKVKRARRGAVAEENIGDILSQLGSDYHVVHDVVCRYGNIDHLVICKTGAIILVETKAHGGKVRVQNGRILVNGHDPEKDFIAQTHRNIYWLRDQIEPITGKKPWVTAVIVFTNAFVEWSAPVQGITVTNKKFLLSTIRKESTRQRPSPVVWEKIDAIMRQIA